MDPEIANPFSAGRRFLLVVVLAVMSLGGWLGFKCWHDDLPVLGLWAEVLLLASPALAVVATRLRVRDSRPGDALTPSEATDRIHQAELSLRAIRGSRAIAMMSLSYAAVLWFCQLGGLMGTRRFVLQYTLISVTAVIAYLPWLARCERRTLEMRESLRRSLLEFKSSRGWGAA